MSILQKYVQREFLKIFLMCFFGLLSTYFLVEFFQRINILLNYRAPFYYKVLYFLLKVPQFVYHITPVAVLVSVLVTLGILNRNRELTAVRSSGIMLYHICLPLVAWGLLISFMVFINNEFIVPHTTRKKDYIYNVVIKKRPEKSVFRQNKIWYYGEKNTIYNIQMLEPAEETLEGITLFHFDSSHSRLLQRVDAKRAFFRDDTWVFTEGTIRTFHDNGKIDVQSFSEKAIDLEEKPVDFSKHREDPDAMNFFTLSGYIRKLKRSGFNPTAYVVDLYAKTSIPLISFFVAILAIPFAFRARPTGGIVSSLGISLALGFGYWIVISAGVSLGHAGRAPPIVAAWAPNIFFLVVGVYLWLNIDL